MPASFTHVSVMPPALAVPNLMPNHARDALRRALRRAGVVLGAAGLLWLGGFGLFLVSLPTAAPELPRGAGIVVLTGGAGRVGEGLRLLEADPTARLLVSGVHQATGFTDLVRSEGRSPQALAERVTLGRAARSTRGNAEETAAWARTQAIDSLIVVTSAYHMPRALLLLRRALPEARLVPHPVTPRTWREPWGRLSPGFLRLAAGEYAKWLAALAGLTEDPFAPPAPTETRTAARIAP